MKTLKAISTVGLALCTAFGLFCGFAEGANPPATEQSSKYIPRPLASGGKKESNGSVVAHKLSVRFGDEKIKVDAVLYALTRAARTDLISLTPSAEYLKLISSLRQGREEYEATGTLSQMTIELLKEQGVTRKEIPSRQAGRSDWQLVMDANAFAKLRIRPATSLASNGFLFIEAYHQLSQFPEFAEERKAFLEAIEKTAREIMDYSDENNDGVIGWGRLWFKGKDGLMLHTSVPAQNMYFGGYTYFPRADRLGRNTCEYSLPLTEETFDHAHNALFLLETFLITRDRTLAERIIQVVGKSFNDTLSEGGEAGPKAAGWYYWKQLGKARGGAIPKCVEGREIKNTNLRMGVALRLYAEILRRNSGELLVKKNHLDSGKYLRRAEQVISTNSWEIISNNNFGYQSLASRNVELAQNPLSARLVYDRTQKEIDLGQPFLQELREIVSAGNNLANRETSNKVTVCSGDVDAPSIDWGVAGSCWNHLAFEAEDYFRLIRVLDLWPATSASAISGYLDPLIRNLAAASLVVEGRDTRYSHYFPQTKSVAVSNEVVNATQFGFFCMVRNVNNRPSVQSMPKAHRDFVGRTSSICSSIPLETVETGVTWKRGYKFYELYLSADRLSVPVDDWLLARKSAVNPASLDAPKLVGAK